MTSHSAADGPVLVTGAAGFVAAHVIQQLQEKGYTVRATVRSLTKDPKAVEQLRNLVPSGSAKPLQLVEADLTKPEGWDAAVAGCAGVFHIAAAVVFRADDPEREVLQPSILGVKHVFEAAAKAKTVKKIVMTSSVAAIYHAAKLGKVYTEADWNSESTLAGTPYNYSKTAAERWAWDFVKSLPEGQKIDLQAINPAIIFGPMLIDKDAPSLSMLERLLGGGLPFVPDFGFGVVDVRDVALAHIRAYELPLSGNRYVLVAKTMTMSDMGREVANVHPDWPVPTKVGPYIFFWIYFLLSRALNMEFLVKNWARPALFDSSKSQRELGITYLPMRQTISDSVDTLVKHHRVPTKQQVKGKIAFRRVVVWGAAVAAVAGTLYSLRHNPHFLRLVLAVAPTPVINFLLK